MVSVSLPISKSIANRRLMLQAMHGDPLFEVSDAFMPDDVRLLHDALTTLQNTPPQEASSPLTLDLQNCGTAMRFLTAYCAQKEGSNVVLKGNERMQERPIGQEVNALRLLGADIQYMDKEGYPPLCILGKRLLKKKITVRQITGNTMLQSSQFISALLLIGIEVETDDDAPYIAMTRQMILDYEERRTCPVERDWSSAAFWYEYVALHGGKMLLQDLQPSSLQGDRCVADIFAHLGVETRYVNEPQQKGVVLTKVSGDTFIPERTLVIDFGDCPDLYPAVALTCERLGIRLQAQGIDRLPLKESDRLLSVREHRTYHDHRVAMAMLAADLPCDDTDCISKSYPAFLSQLQTIRLAHINS